MVRFATLTALVAYLIAAVPTQACSTCFGDPDSSIAKGATAGVFVLAIITYSVVMTLGGTVAFWCYRARKLSDQSEDEPTQT